MGGVWQVFMPTTFQLTSIEIVAPISSPSLFALHHSKRRGPTNFGLVGRLMSEVGYEVLTPGSLVNGDWVFKAFGHEVNGRTIMISLELDPKAIDQSIDQSIRAFVAPPSSDMGSQHDSARQSRPEPIVSSCIPFLWRLLHTNIRLQLCYIDNAQSEIYRNLKYLLKLEQEISSCKVEEELHAQKLKQWRCRKK